MSGTTKIQAHIHTHTCMHALTHTDSLSHTHTRKQGWCTRLSLYRQDECEWGAATVHLCHERADHREYLVPEEDNSQVYVAASRQQQWHCIDYILMSQQQWHLCCDAQVLRSAECWIDHKLLRAKVIFTPSRGNLWRRRWHCVDMLAKEGKRQEYEKWVSHGLAEGRESGTSREKKWEVLQGSILAAADRTGRQETSRLVSGEQGSVGESGPEVQQAVLCLAELTGPERHMWYREN